jgi:hypothetical protein
MKGNANKKKILLTVISIAVSLLFIYLGYLVSGIIGYMVYDDIYFSNAFVSVVTNPFCNYMNGFTILTMIMGGILSLLIIAIILVIVGGGNDKQHGDSNDGALNQHDLDVYDYAEMAGLDSGDSDDFSTDFDNVYEEPKDTAKEVNLADEFVVPDDNDEVDVEDGISGFNDETVSELLDVFDLSQITAMLELQRHMDINDAVTLKKMFKPGMSAETISTYINLFYG